MGKAVRVREKKCYLSKKKMKRGREETRSQRGVGRFCYMSTKRAEYCNCWVGNVWLSPFVLLYFFIMVHVWTINITYLPKETELCSYLSPSSSDLRYVPGLEPDTGVGLALVSLADYVCSCCSYGDPNTSAKWPNVITKNGINGFTLMKF